jgi:hypothetical protein
MKTSTLRLALFGIPALASLGSFAMAESAFQFVPLGRFNEVREDAGSAQVTIARRGSLASPASVRVRALSKHATPGEDFKPLNLVVPFAPSQAFATVTIPITADSLLEGNKKIRLKLSHPSKGSRLARAQTAESLFINDAQDDPPNDDFASANVLRGLDGTLTGTNRGASRQPGEPTHGQPRNRSVWYRFTAPGDGIAKFRAGTSNFKPLLAAYTGASLRTLAARPAVDDSDDPEDSDDFGTLLAIKIKAGRTYHLAIDALEDSDIPEDSDDGDDSDDSDDGHGGGGRAFLLRWRAILPGRLQFETAVTSISEANGPAAISVTRTGGATREVSVRFETANITAVAGKDYTAQSGELVFARGEKRKTLTIPITNDALFEQPKSLRVALSNPTRGARLGLAATTVRIFSDDPFTPGAGKYTAAVTPDVFSHRHTGWLSVETTSLGALTGQLCFGGVKFALSGVLDETNRLVITKNVNGVPLTITLQFTPFGSEFFGSVSDGAVTVPFAGKRNAYSATRPAPQAGRYTLLLPAGQAPGSPRGDGWAKMLVADDGTATLVGAVADGRQFSTAVALTDDGKAPLYVPLYGGKGSLSGTLAFAPNPGISDAAGMLHYFRPPDLPGAPEYRAGFSEIVPAVASAFNMVQVQRILPGLGATNGNATLVLSEGGLSSPLSLGVNIDSDNRVSAPVSPVKLEMTIREKNGCFFGEFKVPGTTRRAGFRGVLFQRQDRAAGLFLNQGVSGSVRLAP